MTRHGNDALREALALHLSEGGAFYGESAGAHGVSAGLSGVRTPLSESLTVGAAVGSALSGARTVAELVDPAGLARAHDVLRDAAALQTRSGGAWSVPLVVLAPWSADARVPEGIATSVAGAPDDVAPLFRAALASGRTTVLFLAEEALHGRTGADAPGTDTGPRMAGGRADAPVTVLACGSGVSAALEAVANGADAEVVDWRSLGSDRAALRARVCRTGRVVLVDAPFLLGPVVQEGFLHLESPPVLVAADPAAVEHAIHASLQY